MHSQNEDQSNQYVVRVWQQLQLKTLLLIIFVKENFLLCNKNAK